MSSDSLAQAVLSYLETDRTFKLPIELKFCMLYKALNNSSLVYVSLHDSRYQNDGPWALSVLVVIAYSRFGICSP